MRQVLEQQRENYDFVHLSNILDWLTPEDAARTLAAAHGALRKGGLVLIRQLNSTLAVRTCHDGFVWLDKQSEQMLAADRSYFYRSIHLGVKA
jgi:S-adenosylmethionine-diacylglycerol 3-amino-3-carboxypropyl transferase